jgi:hypothetical protein
MLAVFFLRRRTKKKTKKRLDSARSHSDVMVPVCGGDMRWQLAEADVFSKKRPPTNQRDCLGRSRGQPFAPEISWVSIRASEFTRYPDTSRYTCIYIYCIYIYYISKYIKIILNMTYNILNIL